MSSAEIQRHKTAIRRGDFSRPVKCLLRDGLIDRASSIFDYGCGRGEDVGLLSQRGFTCSGWDPVFRPDSLLQTADIVNLGYVINVIETPEERASTLRKAWSLCRRLLVASAQVHLSGRGKSMVEFGDGLLTTRGTFQKFFEQPELKSYIETVLGTEAIPAEIGIFYVFKDEARRQQFLSNCFRRSEIAPRRRISELRFEENRELLDPFMAAVATLGRVPDADEWPQAQGAGRTIRVAQASVRIRPAHHRVRRMGFDRPAPSRGHLGLSRAGEIPQKAACVGTSSVTSARYVRVLR